MSNFQKFNGLVLVDKPTGITSHDVVSRVRKIFNIKSVGHSGTLDPLASGLMVCLINEGTKLSQYILEGDKAYTVTVKFGIETDTYDTMGRTLKKAESLNISLDQVLAIANSLQGEFEWPVPIYSAVKLKGQKLYDYARSQQEVEIPKKKMKFWEVTLSKVSKEGDLTVEFFLRCTKGSFIRSWVHELGQRLGCGAVVSALRRTESSHFSIASALTLEELSEISTSATLFSRKAMVPMSESLQGIKKIRIQGQDEALLYNGQISHKLRSLLIAVYEPNKDESIQILSQSSNLLLAIIGLIPEKGFVVKRVFRYQ